MTILEILLSKKMNCRCANNKISCRKFKIPTVDENMTDLNSFLDHQEIFEPPITAKMDIGQINSFIKSPLEIQIPCHSQAVELSIKMVTEAAKSVYGADSRDGFVKARLLSRKLSPTFDSRKDFNF